MSYADRLKRLDLPSLELCRLQTGLMLFYKTVFGLIGLHLKIGHFVQFHPVASDLAIRSCTYTVLVRCVSTARRYFNFNF